MFEREMSGEGLQGLVVTRACLTPYDDYFVFLQVLLNFLKWKIKIND